MDDLGGEVDGDRQAAGDRDAVDELAQDVQRRGVGGIRGSRLRLAENQEVVAGVVESELNVQVPASAQVVDHGSEGVLYANGGAA